MGQGIFALDTQLQVATPMTQTFCSQTENWWRTEHLANRDGKKANSSTQWHGGSFNIDTKHPSYTMSSSPTSCGHLTPQCVCKVLRPFPFRMSCSNGKNIYRGESYRFNIGSKVHCSNIQIGPYLSMHFKSNGMNNLALQTPHCKQETL